MFFVVFYDTWCSTVPESWLNKKCQTLKWPPKSENPTTAAIKQNNPKKSWATIQYSRLLGPFQTYDIARSVEIAAVDLSTSDETAFSKLQDGKLLDRKRNRKPPVRYRKENSSDIPSSDDDGSEFQPDVTDTISRDVFAYDTTQNLDDGNLIETQELDYGNFFNDHPDHSSKRETKKITIRKSEIIPNLIRSYVPQRSDEKIGTLAATKTIKVAKDINENNVESTTTAKSTIQVSSRETSPINQLFPTPVSNEQVTKKVDAEILNLECSPNCCAACSLKLNTILRLLNTLIINQENSNLPSATSRHSLSSQSPPSLLPNFPLIKIEQLTNFNKLLKDNDTARTQYIEIITKRRDPNAKKHTRAVLSYLLTDEFARPLSWTGQKKTIKVKGMAFVEVLIATISQSNPDSSNGMIESAIKSWLQHSGDRIDYRAKNQMQ